MRLRDLVNVAAIAVLFVGGGQLSAQQASPYPMMGGYQAVAPMGYPAAYAPAVPAAYDVRQMAVADEVPPAADCNGCGQPACPQCACSSECWNHKVAVFGEFLYLRARNAEVAYGVPIDAQEVLGDPIQVGHVGVVDQDYNPGFRFGLSYVMDGWSSITTQFTYFEADTSDAISTSAPHVIRSLVSHPGTWDAQRDSRSATASQDIKFEFVDVDYRRVLSCENDHNVAVLAGMRPGSSIRTFRRPSPAPSWWTRKSTSMVLACVWAWKANAIAAAGAGWCTARRMPALSRVTSRLTTGKGRAPR